MPGSYTLKFPVTTKFRAASGQERAEIVSEVTLRAGKARDLMVTDSQVGDRAKSIALVAQLSGLDRKVVGEIDEEDFAELDRMAFNSDKAEPRFVGGGDPIPLRATLQVTAGGDGAAQSVSELTLRRAKAKDGLVVDAAKGHVASTLALVAALTGQQAADLAELDADDFYELGARAWGFTTAAPVRTDET